MRNFNTAASYSYFSQVRFAGRYYRAQKSDARLND